MNRRSGLGHGFTLIEILIAIAIISILAAVLLPMLIDARSRAYDTGTQTCLKDVAARQESFKADTPFVYDATVDPTTIAACANVTILAVGVVDDFYTYDAKHGLGGQEFRVQTGTAVLPVP